MLMHLGLYAVCMVGIVGAVGMIGVVLCDLSEDA